LRKASEGREIDRARRALGLQRLKVSDREDPFAAVIRCTANAAKADKRTRSKWSRMMSYAAAAPGSIRQAEGWHQRVRRTVLAVDGADQDNPVAEAFGLRVMKIVRPADNTLLVRFDEGRHFNGCEAPRLRLVKKRRLFLTSCCGPGGQRHHAPLWSRYRTCRHVVTIMRCRRAHDEARPRIRDHDFE
jgi:hypothetical protein